MISLSWTTPSATPDSAASPSTFPPATLPEPSLSMTRTKKCARRGRGGGKGGHRVNLPMKRGRDESDGEPRRGAFIEIGDRRSAALEGYYSAQRIVPDAEFPALLTALAAPLPSSFRVSAGSRFRDNILTKLREEFPPVFEAARTAVEEAEGAGADAGEESKKGSNADAAMRAAMDEPLQAPVPLSWYPDELGWSVSTPRKMMRRDSSLAPFHKWLVRMNELGAVNRQEAVSMVPPLLIDLRPGQSVVDLCAAPGSKTAQLLEALQNSPPGENALSGAGLVVANDTDIRRCWMLAHQLRRFAAPNLVVTHHDAQSFPSVHGFDRVLADVPCTGDGTLRKNPDIWRKWIPQLGNGIHRLQKNILRRGVELLNPGGRLVYSTCSMNPVENEAVVADALRHFGSDVLRLVDVSDQLPLLKRRAGLKTWMVKDSKLTNEELKAAAGGVEKAAENADGAADVTKAGGESTAAGGEAAGSAGDAGRASSELKAEEAGRSRGWFTSHDEVPTGRTRVVSSLFPPSKEELESGHFPLERCVRLVPHDQDTGAFFVAVLVKLETASFSNKTKAKVSMSEGREPAKEEATVEVEGEDASTAAPADGTVAGETPAGAVVSEGANSEVAAEATVDATAGPSAAPGNAGSGGKKKKDKRGPKHSQHSRLITDDPLVGLERANPAELQAMSSFFGLDEAACRACLMTRGSESHNYNKVLVVTPGVRALLTKSLGSAEGGAAGVRGRLRVVNAGVRLFERTTRRDAVPPFRILSDGVNVLRSAMQKRVVHGDAGDLRLILTQESTAVGNLSGQLRSAFAGLEPGSVLMVFPNENGANEPGKEEVVIVWKGRHVITKLMPADEIGAIRSRHGLEEKPKKLPQEVTYVEVPEQPEDVPAQCEDVPAQAADVPVPSTEGPAAKEPAVAMDLSPAK